MNNLISQIKGEVYGFMGGDSFPGHDYQHVLRVYNLARRIGQAEGADSMILEPAVLMHDLGRVDEAGNPSIRHADASVVYARDILARTCYPSEFHEPIIFIIKYHSWKHSDKAVTLEHKVMQDSDKLDALGAVGIMRCISFGGGKGRMDYNPDNLFCVDEALLNDKLYTMDHFYTKLFRLKDLLHTGSARRIAEDRHRFMEDYLERLKKEIYGEL